MSDLLKPDQVNEPPSPLGVAVEMERWVMDNGGDAECWDWLGAQAIRDLIASEARLRAALGEIAKPTYGTDWTDTDEERAEILGRHLFAAQAIARAALEPKP